MVRFVKIIKYKYNLCIVIFVPYIVTPKTDNMNVNFYLKNETKSQTSVEAIIRNKGKRFKLYTGISVDPNFWDKGTHRARITKDYPDHELVNLKLEEFETKVKNVFIAAIRKSETVTIEMLKNATGKTPETKPSGLFLDYYKAYKDRANIKAKTKKNYEDTATFIEAYQNQTHHKLTFEDINIDFYNTFRNYVLSKIKNKDGDRYSMNYFGTLIKHIKTVMRESGPEGDRLHTNTEYKSRRFIKEAEDADTVYLNTDELGNINKLTIDEETVKTVTKNLNSEQLTHITNQLKHIRNLLMIGCYTALRISDFSRIDWNNISAQYIRIKPLKGTKKNEDVVIPIHPVLKQIFTNGFNPKTRIGNHAINSGIRLLCQLAGINEPITTIRTEGGRQISRTVEKWKLVSSHTARRSGATNMYIAGIPSISIMKITGHRTEKSFMKYIRITQEENARLLAQHAFFKVATVSPPTECEAVEVGN